ncbi:MAG: response regulator transcription factor [Candidatus Muiribacteriota bacterium]
MKKILVADDEKNILRIIKFNLKKAGFEVFTAEDGESAREQIIKERPDIAILDIMMPKINGFDLCTFIKESEDLKTGVILLSAKGQKNDFERGEKAGADLYLKKPFSPKILIKNIKEMLD